MALIVGVGVCVGVSAAHSARASKSDSHPELATAETSISVEAGEHSPRVRTLKGTGAMVWQNQAEETLPERIQVQGSARALLWRFDRAASRFDSKEI
jgi:hypothetical protein